MLAPSPSLAAEQPNTVGPPQVLEIPLRETPPVVAAPSQHDGQGEHDREGESSALLSHAGHSLPHAYLGVLYATAEDGRSGVRVLNVIPDSPADRAGFSATAPIPRESETVLNNAILLLLLTPAFPLGFLASVIHEISHRGLHEGEDLIVAVEGDAVKDAQEFNAQMHRFGSGDTVTFLVQRGTTSFPLSVELEAEPE